MNDPAQKALDRMEAALNRAGRKRSRGFSTAPFVLAGGLVLGYQLLVRLVPRLWASVLPDGFEQGAMFQGWARLVWQLAWFCHLRFPVVLVVAVVLFGVAFVCGLRPLTRPIAWLMAVGIILCDAAVLMIALKAGMDASGVGQVLG